MDGSVDFKYFFHASYATSNKRLSGLFLLFLVLVLNPFAPLKMEQLGWQWIHFSWKKRLCVRKKVEIKWKKGRVGKSEMGREKISLENREKWGGWERLKVTLGILLEASALCRMSVSKFLHTGTRSKPSIQSLEGGHYGLNRSFSKCIRHNKSFLCMDQTFALNYSGNNLIPL